MDRVIQDSDAESDFEISPAKSLDFLPQAPSTVARQRDTLGLIGKPRDQFERFQGSSKSNGAHSSQSSKRRISDMMAPRPSQRGSVKRHRTGETYGSSGRQTRATSELSNMLQDDQIVQGWNMTTSMQQDFIKHQPTMFSDVTSTVPNNTMTQRQLEEEYTGMPQNIITNGDTNDEEDIFSLPYSEIAILQEECQQASGNLPLLKVPIEQMPQSLAQDQDSFQEEEQAAYEADPLGIDEYNFQPEQHFLDYLHLHQDGLIHQNPVHAEDTGPGEAHNPTSSSFGHEEIHEAVKIVLKRKGSKTKKSKKKATSTILSLIPDTEADVEADDILITPTPVTKTKSRKAKRTKTSPASFGQRSNQVTVDEDTLTDVKHRFQKESTKARDVIELASAPSKDSDQDKSNVGMEDELSDSEDKKPIERPTGRQMKSLTTDKFPDQINQRDVTREPLQDIDVNVVQQPNHLEEKQPLPIHKIEDGCSPTLSLPLPNRSNDLLSESGKTLHRVGLSKRARISPLLKSFRK